MSFLDLLEKQEDKVVLTEMTIIKKLLPDRVTKAIPACMYTDNQELDYEVFNILAWILAKRENPEITLKEVGDRIGIKNERLDSIVQEIVYFYNSYTRAEVDEIFTETPSAAVARIEKEIVNLETQLAKMRALAIETEEEEEVEEDEAENPTPTLEAKSEI